MIDKTVDILIWSTLLVVAVPLLLAAFTNLSGLSLGGLQTLFSATGVIPILVGATILLGAVAYLRGRSKR